MSFIGAKQTFAATTLAVNTSTPIGYVTGVAGAIALLVRFRGGDNSTTNLISLTARCAADTSVATALTAAQAPLTLGLGAGALGKTNGDAHNSILYLLALPFVDAPTGAAKVMPMPTSAIQLSAAMATTQSVGVIADVWPIFENPGRVQGGTDLNDLNTY